MSVVLYSARYGDKEPLNAQVFGGFDGVRRVMFSDDPALRLPGIEVVHDPLDGLDPARASRRAKLRPHLYFPEAEWSIWLDNKSRLLTEPQAIVAALQAYQGILGKVLALIECYDAEDIHGCDEILAGFLGSGLDRHMLNNCLTDSLRWINAGEEAESRDARL